MRYVNEVGQVPTNYVRHEAPQHLLVTLTFPGTSHSVGIVAIATNSQQQV